MLRGQGKRCHGYTLTLHDGRRQAWCARRKGPNERNGLFLHWLDDEQFRNAVRKAEDKRARVAAYEYTDRHGEPIARKVRYEPKGFVWEVPDDRGGWRSAREGEGNPQTLYRLPEVVEVEHVHLHEGEKAADVLAKILPPEDASTCIPVWSNKLPADMLEPLRGKVVTVWADRDDHGVERARRLAQVLPEIVETVGFVQSATSGEHDDAYDHVAAGYKVEDAVPLDIDSLDAAGESQANEGPRYRWLSAEEIETAETPEAIVKGMLYRGSLHTIAGPPKTGKSYVAAQLCVCLASGRPFLGLAIPKAVRVGVFTLELAAGPYRDRIEGICTDVGLPVPRWKQNLYVVAPNPGEVPEIDLQAEGHVEKIFADAASRGLEVLLLDTLQRFMVSEEPEVVKRVYRRLSDEAARTGVAVVVVDETAKSWGGPETTSAPAVAAYGTVFKGAIANVCIALQRRGEGDSASWTLKLEGHYPTAGELHYRRPKLDDGSVGTGCIEITTAEAHKVNRFKVERVFRAQAETDEQGRARFPTKTKFKEALAAEGLISGSSSDQADNVIRAIEDDLGAFSEQEPNLGSVEEHPIWVCKHGSAQNSPRSYTWREPFGADEPSAGEA